MAYTINYQNTNFMLLHIQTLINYDWYKCFLERELGFCIIQTHFVQPFKVSTCVAQIQRKSVCNKVSLQRYSQSRRSHGSRPF